MVNYKKKAQGLDRYFSKRGSLDFTLGAIFGVTGTQHCDKGLGVVSITVFHRNAIVLPLQS